ncbi:copper resistance D family protein [Paenibacillus sp. MMO-58]|uniref:copper resistance D family protein n=1 Tax=Paenibacillus sp. MMO-58 TaxID=3081290 RepID=UPI00301B311A
MIILTGLAESLLYCIFALIMGNLVLIAIPQAFKPEIVIPRRVFTIIPLLIPILGFVPILRIVFFFYRDFGFGVTLESVLFTFTEGKAYLLIAILSVLLSLLFNWVDLKVNKKAYIAACCFLIIMIITSGWASHSAALFGWPGFLGNSFHFLSSIIWSGILLIVSWFSRTADWEKFIKWFTPTAIFCFLGIFASGLAIMQGIAPEYMNSWMLSYGQALLLKHLTIVPLMVFAFINGFLYRRKLRLNHKWNPKPWLRVESLLLLILFTITGFMGQQATPHDVSVTIRESGVSTWFQAFQSNVVGGTSNIILQGNVLSYSLALCAIIFISMILYSARRVHAWKHAFLYSICFIIAAYLALMTAA